jgi:hypothetical protein
MRKDVENTTIIYNAPDTGFDLNMRPFLTPSGTLCHLPRKRGRDVRVCDAPSP